MPLPFLSLPCPGRSSRLPVALAAVVTLTLSTAASATTLNPQELREAEVVAAVAAERARAGLAPLAVSPRLTELAREQSAAMAARGGLAHSDDLEAEILDWRALAENVGYGDSTASVHVALMESAPHRANILSAHSARVGIGVTTDPSGRLWVTQIFVQPR